MDKAVSLTKTIAMLHKRHALNLIHVMDWDTLESCGTAFPDSYNSAHDKPQSLILQEADAHYISTGGRYAFFVKALKWIFQMLSKVLQLFTRGGNFE